MKLEIKNLKKSFGDKEVLHGISFTVESGKALGLLGRNGAGKTTTIRILMDVFRGNEGEILMDGVPFDRSKYVIGYLPEERGLYPKKKVLDQMIYLTMLKGKSKAEAREGSLKWLKRLEVEEYASQKLETLSKGNQQKVQLATTLATEPDIIILDEPFSGLDPVNAQILKDVVSSLIEQDRIVIFSSHQMSYVEEFCENVAIIHHGEIVLEGNLSQIKREFGQNQLVVNDVNMDPDQLKDYLEREFSDCVQLEDVRKDYVILSLREGMDKRTFLGRLLNSEIELERFENYKPSLNDIFVAKAGDQE